jgi:hypothetical protein
MMRSELMIYQLQKACKIRLDRWEVYEGQVTEVIIENLRLPLVGRGTVQGAIGDISGRPSPTLCQPCLNLVIFQPVAKLIPSPLR